MSGICVLIDWAGRAIDAAVLQRMIDAAAHRGPDGVSTWFGAGAAAAHLALHVTPEDRAARQPLIHDGHLLVADARIDNRDDLLAVLRTKRLVGRDPSDPELILAAHRHWGHDAPAHVIGDYAYVLLELATGTVVAARDAMGMRALHYRVTASGLAIATEIKQILALPGVTPVLDEAMVLAHLAGPFGCPGRTFYEGIEALEPGHVLTASRTGHTVRRGWSIDPDQRIRYAREEQYVEHFLDLFKGSVRARARTDRSIGILLSGGMDSGSVASTLGWLRTHEGTARGVEINAYSWAFEELQQGDERHVSDTIVDHYGLRRRDVVADELWPLKDHDRIGPDRDAPFTRVYQALMERTLAMARDDGVRVIATGDRGDELVGDWTFDVAGLLTSGRVAAFGREVRALSAWSRRSIRHVLERHVARPILEDGFGWRSGAGRRSRPRRRLPGYVRTAWADAVGQGCIVHDGEAPERLRGFARRRRHERVFFFKGIRDPVLADREAARFGLSLVDPWSDRRLAAFVLAIPQWLVQRPSEPKRIARRAMRGVMPDAALARASKTEPVALYDRAMKDRARATLLDLVTDTQLAARGFIDEEALRSLVHDALADRPIRDDYWWPVTMEMWLRRYWV